MYMYMYTCTYCIGRLHTVVHVQCVCVWVSHDCHMTRLADLMDQHKEELATLESLDSGAVYTLALKTHVGFSVDTFRYYAGWCDKIQVRDHDT